MAFAVSGVFANKRMIMVFSPKPIPNSRATGRPAPGHAARRRQCLHNMLVNRGTETRLKRLEAVHDQNAQVVVEEHDVTDLDGRDWVAGLATQGAHVVPQAEIATDSEQFAYPIPVRTGKFRAKLVQLGAEGEGRFRVVAVIAAVDTQLRYFRYVIRAFGYGETAESWLVQEGVAPNLEALDELFWKSAYLDALDRPFKVKAVMIDAMGEPQRTAQVYAWAPRNRGPVFPAQGVHSPASPITFAPQEYFPGPRGERVRILNLIVGYVYKSMYKLFQQRRSYETPRGNEKTQRGGVVRMDRPEPLNISDKSDWSKGSNFKPSIQRLAAGQPEKN